MGTVVAWSNATIKDICFTQFEWAQFANAMNKGMSDALTAGLVIGAVAGIIGYAAAMWFKEKYDKD
jgi:hypothetical protein